MLPFRSQNFIVNGDFELGGPGVGFNSTGNGYNFQSPPYLGNTFPGDFTITSQPELFNSILFLSVNDHTSGNGNMLVVDGGTQGGNQNFWQAGDNGGGVCNLTPGSSYVLQYWLHSISTSVINPATQADVKALFTNASNVQVLTSPTLAPLPSAGWQPYLIEFTANASCVNIALYDNNLSAAGNDFAVDDIAVLPLEDVLFASASAVRPNCSDSLSGAITVYAKGGVPPYNFQLNGPSGAVNNSNGIFPGLASGTYTCSVTDFNNQSQSLLNLIVFPNNYLEVTPTDTAVCANTNVQIVVNSGQSPTYLWTASPPDPGLLNPTNDTIVVSPNQSTTYQVSTNDINYNLITNGNFEAGNTSFINDLTYYSPSNPLGNQSAYGTVPNANFWNTSLAACVDHTLGNGVGLMLVVNGATAGNMRVWKQAVAVEKNKNYTFQYHSQSVNGNNPAILQARINGMPIYLDTVSGTTCSWQMHNVNWNSGNDTLAMLELFNLNQLAAGNEFALDDIAFFTLRSCTNQSQVVIQTPGVDLGLTYPSALCSGFSPVSPQLNPGVPTTGVYIGQPAGLNIDPISGVIQSNGSMPGPYTVTYSTNLCNAVYTDTFSLEIHPLPLLQSLTGGAYDCPSLSFDSVLLYLNAQFPVQVIYTINGVQDTISGANNPLYLGNEAGLYTLNAITDVHCASGLNGTLLLDSLAVPQLPIVVGDTAMCENEPSTMLSLVNANPNGVVSWYSDAALTQFLESGNAFYPSNDSSSTYYVVQTVGGCSSPVQSFSVQLVPCNLVIPSAFTPDNDGDNDVWEIIGLDSKFPLNQVKVFNRWGELLYSSQEGNYAASPWDGVYKGKLLPSGSYYYVLEKAADGSVEPTNGIVSIIRKP
jgi:gliding motility-associated-like protein